MNERLKIGTLIRFNQVKVKKQYSSEPGEESGKRILDVNTKVLKGIIVGATYIRTGDLVAQYWNDPDDNNYSKPTHYLFENIKAHFVYKISVGYFKKPLYALSGGIAVLP